MHFPLLLIRQSRSELLLRKYMEGDDKNVLKLLKRDGRKEKDLSVQILQYFVNKCTNTKDRIIENNVRSSNNANQINSDGEDDDDDRYVCYPECRTCYQECRTNYEEFYLNI